MTCCFIVTAITIHVNTIILNGINIYLIICSKSQHEACNHGYLTITELLLDHGALIDIPGGFDHDSPLHDAVTNGRLDVARLLVSKGAPLDVR